MPLAVRPARPDEHPRAAALLNESLGENAFTAAGLTDRVAQGALLLLLFVDDQLCGAALGEVLDEDRTWFAPFGTAGRAAIGEGPTGLLTGIAIRPGHRAQGRGQTLARPLLRHLEDRGCTRIIAVSWLSGGPNPSGPLLERLGFVPIIEAADVFLDDSRRHGLVCPTCHGDCRCPGLLYLRHAAS